MIYGNDISGTLHYVEDYTEFSSLPEQQSGNYLALKVDEDKNIVLLIADEDTQSVRVTVKKGTETESRTYSLKNLTLEIE